MGSRLFLDVPAIDPVWVEDSTRVVVAEGDWGIRFHVSHNGAVGHCLAYVVPQRITAREGADYSAIKQGTCIHDGDSTSPDPFFVRVFDDAVADPAEEFALELGQPDSGGTLDPIRRRIGVCIVDNDNVPPFGTAPPDSSDVSRRALWERLPWMCSDLADPPRECRDGFRWAGSLYTSQPFVYTIVNTARRKAGQLTHMLGSSDLR